MKNQIECTSCRRLFYVNSIEFETEVTCPYCNVLWRNSTLMKEEFKLCFAVKVMAVEFRKDIENLLNMGIKIDKGALVAKSGGALGTVATACSGHWLAAVAIGVVSLFTDSIGSSYKKIKLREFQLKWLKIVNQLNDEQRTVFAMALEVECPLIKGAQLSQFLLSAE